MNVEDNMDDVENKKFNEIFMYWSPEKIKHCYGLMWEKSNEQETIDDENEIVEKGVEMDWSHPSCNKKQYLDFIISSRKKTIENIKVWSSKSKKTFLQYVEAKIVKMKCLSHICKLSRDLDKQTSLCIVEIPFLH